MFDPYSFEALEWDDEEDDDGNLQHCLSHGLTEKIVNEVLRTEPIEIRFAVVSADFALVGPTVARDTWWTILFGISDRRGDWLRPITGWPSKPQERARWSKIRGSDRT